jgi:hypothetical protein
MTASARGRPAPVVKKDPEYILNHCTKFLARDNTDGRHSYFGAQDGQLRASVSESWRFPIVDAHDGEDAGAAEEDRSYEWNDVTFVFAGQRDGPTPNEVRLISTCHTLYDPVDLDRVDDSIFWACTLQVRKGQRHRYKFLVDGRALLDPINPQVERLPTGESWSSFFTWAYNQPITFEPWEFVLLERLTRHILPFNNPEAQNFIERGANEGIVGHLYRLDVPLGVANYIDKVVAREERHQLYAYKTCLEMLDRVLRLRNSGKDLRFLDESQFVQLYREMADDPGALYADGWDRDRYDNPSHFLWLLRRHAWTGAFAHPKYGGNPGGLAWAYLAERFKTDDGGSAFAWWRAIEPPLGRSTEYRG